jgi:circadian clock protein KaiC
LTSRPPLKDGRLEIIYLRSLDLSVDDMMQELIDAVQRTGVFIATFIAIVKAHG